MINQKHKLTSKRILLCINVHCFDYCIDSLVACTERLRYLYLKISFSLNISALNQVCTDSDADRQIADRFCLYIWDNSQPNRNRSFLIQTHLICNKVSART